MPRTVPCIRRALGTRQSITFTAKPTIVKLHIANHLQLVLFRQGHIPGYTPPKATTDFSFGPWSKHNVC